MGELVMQSVVVGRDVRTVGEGDLGIELEGRTRLRPGREVDVLMTTAGTTRPTGRRAVVWSWNVKRLGRDGPIFRGICHWTS